MALPLAQQSYHDDTDIRLSFEFFPPKTEKMAAALSETIKKLEPFAPDFVSVTYGAGGSTRTHTQKTVIDIAQTTGISAAAHLTCVGSDKAEIDAIAQSFWDAGIRHIVALRGDPQDGIGKAYVPTPNGYAYGADLVAGLKRIADFDVSVSAYPERHPESPHWAAEIDNLKRKIDAGASRAITQFFFEADTFLRFVDRARDAGITIPIVPGIMLQPNFKGLKRMSAMCNVAVPDWYAALFEGLDDEPLSRSLLTGSTASDLCAGLYREGVRDFHLYTLNRPDIAIAVSRLLGRRAVKTLA